MEIESVSTQAEGVIRERKEEEEDIDLSFDADAAAAADGVVVVDAAAADGVGVVDDDVVMINAHSPKPPSSFLAELKDVNDQNAILLSCLNSTKRLNKLLGAREIALNKLDEQTKGLVVFTEQLLAGTLRSGVKTLLSAPVRVAHVASSGGGGGGGGGVGGGGGGGGVAAATAKKPIPADGFSNKAYLDFVIDPKVIDPAGGPDTFNLANANHACYLATILISALAMPDLVKALCDAKNLNVLDRRPLQHAFYDIFQRLLCPDVKFTMDKTNIKQSLDMIFRPNMNRYTRSNNQRDPVLVWRHVLELLELEAGLSPFVTKPDFISKDAAEIRQQISQFCAMHRTNVIREIFGTIMVTTHVCQVCRRQTNKFDVLPLINLTLPPAIAKSKETTIPPLSLLNVVVQFMLQHSVTIEEYSCECNILDDKQQKVKTTCTETFAFGSLPRVVVFFVQRAIQGSSQKIEEKSFQRIIPEEIIELTSLDKEKPTKFVLVSVSIHDGLGDGGHYVTLSRFKGKYYFFNDVGSERRETTLEAAFGDEPPFDVDLSKNSLLFYYVQED
jgi:ubiquitin C-terminal hydrolase